jgi:RluA family pseudouridine synthase
MGRESLLQNLITLYSFKIYVVHRLDKEVSGVILFAKNSTTHRFLNEQFNQRLIRKTYVALVHGSPAGEDGDINEPIRQCGSGRMAVDWERGKECSTSYRVRERYKNFALLSVYPHTGRRHQIRVHLYSIGNPIVGDLMYGNRKIQKGFPRLMLHAHKIEYKTTTGEVRQVVSTEPDLFSNVVAMCKR